MKTICMAALMAALFFVSTPVLTAGTPDPGSLLIKSRACEEGTALRLQLANLQGRKTFVSLRTIEGAPLFSKTVTDHNGYLVELNMATAEEGRYILRVTHEEETYHQVIYYRDGELAISQVTAG